MGCLHTGPQQVFIFDDRVLAHLRAVIFGKLSLQESFVFTWNDSGAQRSIWMHPGMSVQFEFDSTEAHEINREWIEALTALANSAGGLRLVPESSLEAGAAS
ncbi:hypothetical protein MUN76_11980 [Leucobacter rhizosphaerae]|uniref:DUF7882 domain-containing protein n=1 Tax=Leucobacter rhizosphaerae TaxID=2932245 RepID=A0ABY4FU19_9MICO|nr:hypothetical protein [Leucobacter rhizosphaerae]UOQ59760.1 hypothetical protein MUN76_11980 [Leucobacter rhizosphaerae]